MKSIISFELYKIFRRPRTYIAFGAIAALIIVIQFGLKIDGKSYSDFLMKDINDTLTVDGNVLNGYLICYILLQLLLVHVPLLVALIAADMLELLQQPWPWYVAGPLIGLTVPALLLVGNKALGISSAPRKGCTWLSMKPGSNT